MRSQDISDRLASRLGQVGLGSRQLSATELRELYYQLLNPNRARTGLSAPACGPRDTLWGEQAVRRLGPALSEYSDAEQLVSEDLREGVRSFVQGAAQQLAKQVCMGCPVIAECLADSLDNLTEFGVWGGMTERERRALLKRRPQVTSWRALFEADRTRRELSAS